jgi:hypothetical protein
VAIRPRVKTSTAVAAAETDETAIAAIINRGGAPAGPVPPVPVPTPPPVLAPVAVPAPVPAPEPSDADPEKKFTLRLPASLLAAIEKDAKGRPDRISVNTWLIGAALQRLDRRPPEG